MYCKPIHGFSFIEVLVSILLLSLLLLIFESIWRAYATEHKINLLFYMSQSIN